MRITGIILAGGESLRMGTPKPLLKIGQQNFTDIIIRKFHQSGIDNIYLVLGAHHKIIEKKINVKNLNIVINKFWRKGQLSSLKAAIKGIPDTDAVLVALVDHPSVRVTTIKKLLCESLKSNADIIIPVYKNRGGHPVVFKSTVFKALMEAPLSEGARAVIDDGRFNILRVSVNDPFIRQDIDTPKDYEKITEGI